VAWRKKGPSTNVPYFFGERGQWKKEGGRSKKKPLKKAGVEKKERPCLKEKIKQQERSEPRKRTQKEEAKSPISRAITKGGTSSCAWEETKCGHWSQKKTGMKKRKAKRERILRHGTEKKVPPSIVLDSKKGKTMAGELETQGRHGSTKKGPGEKKSKMWRLHPKKNLRALAGCAWGGRKTPCRD